MLTCMETPEVKVSELLETICFVVTNNIVRLETERCVIRMFNMRAS
jgi:hypothetical protein